MTPTALDKFLLLNLICNNIVFIGTTIFHSVNYTYYMVLYMKQNFTKNILFLINVENAYFSKFPTCEDSEQINYFFFMAFVFIISIPLSTPSLVP